MSVSGSARGRGDLQMLDWNALRERARHVVSGMARAAARIPEPPRRGQRRIRCRRARRGPRRSRARISISRRPDVVTQLPEGPSRQVRSNERRLDAVVTRGDRWSSRAAGACACAGRRDPDSAFDVELARQRVRACWICAPAPSYLRAESLLPLTGFLPQKDVARPAARDCADRRMDGYVDRTRARAR